MVAKKNNVGNKEFNELIRNAKRAFERINKQEHKIGENIFNLGKTLFDIKKQNKKHTYYESFDKLCEACFAFSRQYGCRMINFYEIQKDLHEKGLLNVDTYLSNSILLSLKRAQNPSEVWAEACRESEAEPTEKLISQIIDRNNLNAEESKNSLQDDIAQATTAKIISVLQKIKNKKYSPSDQERKQLIALLEKSWDMAKNEELTSEDFESEEIA